jgi:beta-glucanase (GH16 family)
MNIGTNRSGGAHFAKVALLVLATCGTASAAVFFRDDFSSGPLNTTTNWNVGNAFLGRTQEAFTPQIASDGTDTYARLRLDTFNSNNRVGNPNNAFNGSELFSKQTFPTSSTGVRFEARVRNEGALPAGLVTSFFTYEAQNTTINGVSGTFSDEMDFEFLTTQQNATHNGSPNNAVLDSTFHNYNANGSNSGNINNHNSAYSTFPPGQSGPDLSQWHTYDIDWFPDHINWSVDGTQVRTTTIAIPTNAMPIRANFWAPASDFSDAFSASLQPATSSAGNTSFFYDVDYIQVSTVPEPASVAVLAVVTIATQARPRRRRPKLVLL